MQTFSICFVPGCRSFFLSFIQALAVECRRKPITIFLENIHTCHKPKSLKALSRFAVHTKIHQEFMTHTHTHTIYDDMIICTRQALNCVLLRTMLKNPVQVYVALCRKQLSKDLSAEACGSQTWQRS